MFDALLPSKNVGFLVMEAYVAGRPPIGNVGIKISVPPVSPITHVSINAAAPDSPYKHL